MLWSPGRSSFQRDGCWDPDFCVEKEEEEEEEDWGDFCWDSFVVVVVVSVEGVEGSRSGAGWVSRCCCW